LRHFRWESTVAPLAVNMPLVTTRTVATTAKTAASAVNAAAREFPDMLVLLGAGLSAACG
jgi:hypothetical protein